MFEAQLLISKSSEYAVLSPWMARGGDGMVVTLQVVEVSGASVALDVELLTKNTEDTGPGGGAVTSGTRKITGNSVDIFTEKWVSGQNNVELKELVRYQFTVTTGNNAGEWILFRMLSPVWLDAVQA